MFPFIEVVFSELLPYCIFCVNYIVIFLNYSFVLIFESEERRSTAAKPGALPT